MQILLRTGSRLAGMLRFVLEIGRPLCIVLHARVYRVRHRDQVLPFALCEAGR